MIEWTYNSAKTRFVVVVTGTHSDQEIFKVAADVHDSEYFVPGIDVLIDSSKGVATISPVEMGQIFKFLNKKKEQIKNCRYAIVVARSSGLIMANILAVLATLLSVQVRGFVNLKARRRGFRKSSDAMSFGSDALHLHLSLFAVAPPIGYPHGTRINRCAVPALDTVST